MRACVRMRVYACVYACVWVRVCTRTGRTHVRVEKIEQTKSIYLSQFLVFE